MHPVDFVTKWSDARVKERSAAQEHFLDLCRVVGAPTPVEADPEGSFYMFERGAGKLGGGDGWADVWYRGHFAWEYKGRGRDLAKAYQQLALYCEELENPPLLVVSDLDVIEIHTNFTRTVKQVNRITLENFTEAKSQRILRALFFAPDTLRPSDTPEEAAERFGQIAQGLQARGENPHAVAHFLVQVLFCLFAEDIGLLPHRVFSKLLDSQAEPRRLPRRDATPAGDDGQRRLRRLRHDPALQRWPVSRGQRPGADPGGGGRPRCRLRPRLEPGGARHLRDAVRAVAGPRATEPARGAYTGRADTHAKLDRAVWDAFGWPGEEVPAEVEEDVILGRLLALNQERAAGQ